MQIEFEKTSFDCILLLLKEKKALWKALSSIKHLEKVDLKTCGNSDVFDNFQIFTPRFIVDGMIEAVGKENITDYSKRILEPTSGDGAFTCRILELRLEKIVSDDKEAIFEETLKALSTIYSIELDEELIKEQRNNIYTVAADFLKDKGVDLTEEKDACLKFLINENFIWGETDIDGTPNPILCRVAYRMPESTKHPIAVEFPVWEFDKGLVSLHYEDPEIGD